MVSVMPVPTRSFDGLPVRFKKVRTMAVIGVFDGSEFKVGVICDCRVAVART